MDYRDCLRGCTLRAKATTAWLGVILSATACSGLLDVDRPDIVETDNLSGPAGLATVRTGAFGEFAKAYGGDASAPGDVRENQVLVSGLLGDEFKALETDGSRIVYDARQIAPNTSNGNLERFYLDLHRARQGAETAVSLFESVAPPNADTVIAEMKNLSGFILTFLGEDYCSGIPISTLSLDGVIEYGQPLTTTQVFELSETRFSEALTRAQAANVATLQQLAQVGRGRALLNLGRYVEAAQAVAAVPTSFLYLVRYSASTARQQNGVFYSNNQLERWSMDNRKGINGIDYMDAYTAGDPRTPWAPMPGDGLGFDRSAGPGYVQLKYPNSTAPIPLASGIEARLIEAEAALQANDITAFQSIHNALRATLGAAAVGPVDAAAMTAAQRVDFHFRERALWLYATGHRLGDMRRLIRQHGRTEDQVFPTGPYYRPVYPNYGNAVNLPIPTTERNNPNFTGCLDLNA
jgi:hypothetical protein